MGAPFKDRMANRSSRRIQPSLTTRSRQGRARKWAVIKEKHLVAGAIGILACFQIALFFSDVPDERGLRTSRRLSTDLGDGKCAWTRAVRYKDGEEIPNPTTLFAGYPGSGKRLAWMMIEALTGHVAGDDWDLSQHGTNVVALKTGYPHHEGTWGWGDKMDQVILGVRNPRWALPSFHTMRTELDWSETWSQSFYRIPWVYTERPPNEQWETWRDENFDKEVQEYGKYIDYWMEGGVLIPEDGGPPEQDPHCGTPDSVGWMDMPNCKPKAVVMFENLFDNTTAHTGMTLGASEMFKIAQAIDGGPDSTVIANDTWYCIYNETFKQPRYNRHRDANPDHPDSMPRETYKFTIPQFRGMITEVTRLYNKYSSPPWDTDPLAQDLSGSMSQYLKELNEELEPLIPCDACPDGYTASFNETTLRTAVDMYTADRDSAVEQYGVINCWNVSQVKDFKELFKFKTFNEDISCWDMSNALDMSHMFRQGNFNQDVSSWVVSNALDMSHMFRQGNFNQDISSWDVSSVTNMRGMFLRAPFNQDISSWNVSSVGELRGMFFRTRLFNQNLCAWGDKMGPIDDQDFVKDMFYEALRCPTHRSPDILANPKGPFCHECCTGDDCPPRPCEQCTNGWTANMDDGNIRDAVDLYVADRNSAVRKYGIMQCWNVSKVTDMSGLFWGKAFNEDLSCWDTSSVVDMTDMFRASHFNQDISGWNVESVTTMYRTFLSSYFNQDLTAWNVSTVQDIRLMFYKASYYNISLCGWGDKLTITDLTLATTVFLDTACPSQTRPRIEANPATPFCMECS